MSPSPRFTAHAAGGVATGESGLDSRSRPALAAGRYLGRLGQRHWATLLFRPKFAGVMAQPVWLFLVALRVINEPRPSPASRAGRLREGI
ncbi:MAG: hypothetical protein NZL92_04955 [Gloeomargarita sp. SKYG116]|nr:hypothetical protein [Gloeomargarita sp. SKYG116]MDW8401025.1 hypothetical protein [Gloeomargarita sp. SKYGB_i_bin116]